MSKKTIFQVFKSGHAANEEQEHLLPSVVESEATETVQANSEEEHLYPSIVTEE